ADELVTRPDVTACVIAVSSAQHLDVIRRAAAAGREIYCEKPLALTVDQTEAAMTAASTAGVRLQVGFMRRFDLAYRRARKRLMAGEIGDPIMFTSIQFDPGPPPLAFADPTVSGGIHIDMGIHDYDLARWLMDDEVVAVHAWGSAVAYPDLATVGDVDSAVISLRYARGGTGSVLLARSSLSEDVRTEIVGTRGTIAIGDRPPRPRRHEAVGTDAAVAPAGWGAGALRFDRAYVAELRAFTRSIVDDRPVPVGGPEALAALRIALAADRSMREGRPVAVADE
ncbi:MAG TPA: Gfo/Idh/MocA family oxidoreductase, partial [Candidatus Saccharimonadia bacterium]|nr:Gfo/Idh/MocA family oxidoreductase [Candidatus Saccharimonadia bacterium]